MLAASTDGITWTGAGASIFTQWGNCVAWNGTIWVAGGQGTNSLATSPDGSNWTVRSSPLNTVVFAVAWNGSYWLASGSGTSDYLMRSSNGIDWTGLGAASPLVGFMYGIAWNGTMWLMVGQGTLLTSPEGSTWTQRGGSLGVGPWYSVAWSGSVWVVGGYNGGNSATVISSSNGIDWVTRISTSTSTGFGECLAVAWNGSLWVALADNPGGSFSNTLATSIDGLTWTMRGNTMGMTTGTVSRPWGLTWNGNYWVGACKGNYNIVTSRDGITWTGLVNGVNSPFSLTGHGIASKRVLPFIGTSPIPYDTRLYPYLSLAIAYDSSPRLYPLMYSQINYTYTTASPITGFWLAPNAFLRLNTSGGSNDYSNTTTAWVLTDLSASPKTISSYRLYFI